MGKRLSEGGIDIDLGNGRSEMGIGTSIEHRSNIQRTSIEHLSNIHCQSIGDTLKMEIHVRSMQFPLNMHREPQTIGNPKKIKPESMSNLKGKSI